MVSVIVPVYNVNRFLNKCISSIVKQTYTDIEIILVDDGSTDGSEKCCDKWQKKDSRIKVIHKENEGVSIARNEGMKWASGEYLCFVDSDDFLPENSIAALMSYMIRANVDLCCGSWTKISVKRIEQNKNNSKTILKSDIQGLFEYLNIEEVNGPVAKIYKTDIIRNECLQFVPGIKIGEDAIFNYQYIEHCGSVAIVSDNVYYYNKLNDGSATHNYYADFSKCCLLSAIAQVKALGSNVIDQELGKVQQHIFCKRFLSAVTYLRYYNLSAEIAKSEIRKTCLLFRDYIDRQVICSVDSEDFRKVEEILKCCESNALPISFLINRSKGEALIRAMYSFVLSVIAKCKNMMILRGWLRL